MINAWSLLYDEIYGDDSMITTATNKDYDEFWENNGNALSFLSSTSDPDVLSFVDPGSSTPPIVFSGSGLPGGDFSDSITFGSSSMGGRMGDDHITLKNVNLNSPAQKQWKYNENEILKELTGYITDTYNQHYSSDQIQTLDLIESCGDGEAFCRSNILKYASRYDKKGTARRDILKIMHYAVLLMYFNDKNTQSETYNQ
jgi:hypothetical protein